MTGTATWGGASGISGTINFIHENALAVARMANVLAPTIQNVGATGMFLRRVWEWQPLSFIERTDETVDEASRLFSKTHLTALTPRNFHCRADLTDVRIASDPDGVRAACAMELGSAAARHIDVGIASLFGTGVGWAGTVGPADPGTAVGGTITWRRITAALAILANEGVPAGAPIFCALHPWQWEVLLASSSVAAASVAVAPEFQNAQMGNNFFRTPMAYGVTFVVTNAMPIAGTAAFGLMYSPQALILDTRRPFMIEPDRDPSKQAWELNASMWYVAGVWRPRFAVLLRHQAVVPTG